MQKASLSNLCRKAAEIIYSNIDFKIADNAKYSKEGFTEILTDSALTEISQITGREHLK